MASISEKISSFLGEQRGLIRDFYHLDYWDDHTLVEGFAEAADGATELLHEKLEGSHRLVQASAGAGLGVAKLLGALPVGLIDWVSQVTQEIPKGPGQTIYKVFEVPIKGFYHGGVFVFETTKQWSDGSLNNKDSYAIANEVTGTLGMAALLLFGMKKGVDGGGKFLSGMQGAADLAVAQAQNGMATATVTAGSVALAGGSDLLAGVMMMSSGEGNGGGKKTDQKGSAKEGAQSVTPEEYVETKLAEIDHHRSLLFGRSKRAAERSEMMKTLIEEIERRVRDAKSINDQALWKKAAQQAIRYLAEKQGYIIDGLTLRRRAERILFVRKKLGSLEDVKVEVGLFGRFYTEDYDSITTVSGLGKSKDGIKYVALYYEKSNRIQVRVFSDSEIHARMVDEDVWLMGAGRIRIIEENKLGINGHSEGFPTPPEYLAQIAEAIQRTLDGDVRVQVDEGFNFDAFVKRLE